jgi:uncharacterized protein YggE
MRDAMMTRNTITTLALIGLLWPAVSQAEETVTGTKLSISANAEIKSVPDIATVSTGVITIAPEPKKALEENAAKMDAVFKALTAAGIAAKDIQTADMSVEPQYAQSLTNKAPRIVAYQVNNNVSVTIRDIRNIGAALDALIAQGANQLNGPEFSVEDKAPALDQARKAAMEKAQKSAAVYAAAAGLKIKRIISISEQGGIVPRPYPVRPMMAMASMASAPTPVAAGQVTTEITINVDYELAP